MLVNEVDQCELRIRHVEHLSLLESYNCHMVSLCYA